jgi:CRP-like cAMP-binding protein
VLDSFSISNRILGRLPRRDYRRLLRALELIDLKFGQVVYRHGDAIKHVYFPNDCMMSLMTPMGDRQVSEVGVIGREGMIGVQAALGARKISFQNIVQGEGTAMRLPIARFHRELKRSGALKRETDRFASLLMVQFAQTAGCNRYHDVANRLARWLLMCRDRIGSNEFRMTQQFLAYMLGVQRPRISGAAGELQKRRLIRYSRGRITILDGRGLLAASCSCYEQVKSAYRED